MKAFCDEMPDEGRPELNAFDDWTPFELGNNPAPACDCLGGWMVEVRPPSPLKVDDEPRGVPANGCDPKPDRGEPP